MSETPQSEEIEDDKASLIRAIHRLNVKLRNRAEMNKGGWTEPHRHECNRLASDLTVLQIRVEQWV